MSEEETSLDALDERGRPDRHRGEAFQLGGNPKPVKFSETQIAVLEALVDEIIPPAPGFPAPSEVGVIEEFFTRYVDADEVAIAHFPYARERTFKAKLDELAPTVLEASGVSRVALLAHLERDDAELFGQLRALTYAGYYSRPEIVRALRLNLPAARDYRGRPQPYGYAEVTEDWAKSELKGGRGTYIATADVERVY